MKSVQYGKVSFQVKWFSDAACRKNELAFKKMAKYACASSKSLQDSNTLRTKSRKAAISSRDPPLSGSRSRISASIADGPIPFNLFNTGSSSKTKLLIMKM